jgi:cobalt-zinc-cadmium efflux system membrane fusion protein
MPRFFMLGSIAVGLVAICAAVGTAIKSVPPVLAWAQTAFAGDTDVRALFEISAPTARPAPPPPAERDAPLAVNGTNGSELLEISASRIEAAGIEVAPVAGAVLRRRLVVPGIITADASRIARVAAKVIGTVAELRKQLGDPVAKGEVVAVLDSREVAEAKAEYL